MNLLSFRFTKPVLFQNVFIEESSFLINSGHAQHYNSYFLLFIASFATILLVIINGLLRPIDAQSSNYRPQGNSGTYNEKMLALKRRIPPDAKNINLLHGLRIKRSFDCKKEADDKLMGFIKSFRAVGSKYQDLFKNIGSLKCIYVSISQPFFFLLLFQHIFERDAFNS